MQRAIGFSLLLLITLGCGSGAQRPANVAAPTILIEQTNPIFFGSGSSAPVSLDVHIRNNANVPLRVREVELRSPGMAQYTILRVSRLFGETIPPGETRTVNIMATAVRQSGGRLEEPLQVSALLRLEANGQQFREIILRQTAGSDVN